jgi:hypothetical protein
LGLFRRKDWEEEEVLVKERLLDVVSRDKNVVQDTICREDLKEVRLLSTEDSQREVSTESSSRDL